MMEVEQGFRASDFSTVAALYNHQGNLLKTKYQGSEESDNGIPNFEIF